MPALRAPDDRAATDPAETDLSPVRCRRRGGNRRSNAPPFRCAPARTPEYGPHSGRAPRAVRDGKPSTELAGLHPARTVPRHLDRPQKPKPPQQVHSIRADRGLAAPSRKQVTEERRDRPHRHPPTAASSCRPMTTVPSFGRYVRCCRLSTSAACEFYWIRGINEVAGWPASERLRAHAGKRHSGGRRQVFRVPPVRAQETGPSAHEPLISLGTVAGVPLGGLSFVFLYSLSWQSYGPVSI